MQITVLFKGKDTALPIATSETVQGLIYRAISQDRPFSARVHNKGNVFAGRSFKLFTFGELKGKYTIKDKSIVYSSDITLEVRSADPYFIQQLLRYFSLNPTVSLGANSVAVADIKLSERAVHKNRAVIKTASPITAYITEADGHTRYFTPEEESFYRMIASNAARKWASYNGNADGFELKLSPIPDARYIKRATRFKDTYITAWHGSFVLEAKPEIISFLYNTGLGSKNSQGFGMFDIIS